MQRVKKHKSLPSICIRELTLQFAMHKDAQRVQELLLNEPLLEIVTDPQVMTELSQQEKKIESNKKKSSARSSGRD